MKDFLFCAPLPGGREICVAPVSREAFEDNKAYELGDDYGYFIYEFETNRPCAGIEILAKAASYDAALRLVDIYTSAQPSVSAP